MTTEVLMTVLGLAVCVSMSLGQTPASSAAAAQPGQLVLPPSGPLVFVGGSGCNATNAEAVLREFAAAGFTHSWAGLATEADRAQLDAAQALGIKLIYKHQDGPATPAEVARMFKGHPALAGYMLMDEPGAADFPGLTDQARAVLKEDPDPAHVLLVNLYPNGATHEQLGLPPYGVYADYVFKFLSEVPVNLLSYDCYPIKRLEVVPGWYENLAVGMQAARSAKLPLWVWIASAGMDLSPDPTLGSLRLQAYNNLAYGATGIEHFTYHNHAGMRQACIERDGSRSPTYYLIQQLHRELQAQASVFVGSLVRRVRWAGTTPPPPQVERYEPRSGILTIDAGNKGAIVSELTKDTCRFLVIVNQDYLGSMPLSVGWKPGLLMGSVQKDGSVQMIDGAAIQTVVGPGDALILMCESKPK